MTIVMISQHENEGERVEIMHEKEHSHYKWESSIAMRFCLNTLPKSGPDTALKYAEVLPNQGKTLDRKPNDACYILCM